MENFSLKDFLIPILTRENIKFRILKYENGNEARPESLIVWYNYINVCRVDRYHLNSSACYKVVWHAKTIDHLSTIEYYSRASELVRDIRKVIDFNFKWNHINGREDKMNKKLYKVTNMDFKSSINPDVYAEIDFTVNVMNPSGTVGDDCKRIRDAIENISDTKESCYILCGRGNGKTRVLRDTILREMSKNGMTINDDIKDVIFNNPATIVLWADGTKTVVKAENEEFDPEKGLAMAIAKKALGNSYDYYDVFKKYVGRYEKKQKKGGK